jgi:hypothetical protein
VQSDNHSISLGGFADWQVTHAIRASVRGGPTYYTFYGSGGRPGSTLDGYYFSLELEHQVNDFLSQRASLRHDISLGLNSGSDYVESTTASYTVSCALTRWLNASMNFSFQRGNQPLPVAPNFEVIENFEQYGVSPVLSWQMTDRFTASLNYSYWTRTSDLPGRNYTQNTVDLRLNYNF